MFCAVAARLSSLSHDRPDSYVRHHDAVLKDVSAKRTRLKNMKRVGRFLGGRPRVGCLCE